jgi:hypothetical protein
VGVQLCFQKDKDVIVVREKGGSKIKVRNGMKDEDIKEMIAR